MYDTCIRHLNCEAFTSRGQLSGQVGVLGGCHGLNGSQDATHFKQLKFAVCHLGYTCIAFETKLYDRNIYSCLIKCKSKLLLD